MKVYILFLLCSLKLSINSQVYEFELAMITKFPCNYQKLPVSFCDQCESACKSMLLDETLQQPSKLCSFDFEIPGFFSILQGFSYDFSCKSGIDCNYTLYCNKIISTQPKSEQSVCYWNLECQCIDKKRVNRISDSSKGKKERHFYQKLQDAWNSSHIQRTITKPVHLTKINLDTIPKRRRRLTETLTDGYYSEISQSYSVSISEDLSIDSLASNKVGLSFKSGANVSLLLIEDNTYTLQIITNDGENPRIKSLSNNNYVLIWVRLAVSSTEIVWKLLDANDMVLDSEIDASSSPIFDEIELSPSSLPNENLAVFWNRKDSIDLGYSVKGKYFKSDGTVITDDFDVDTTSTDNQGFPVADSNKNGDIIVVWIEKITGDNKYNVITKTFDSVGTSIASSQQVNLASIRVKPNICVSALSNNSFIVLWINFASDLYKIKGNVLNPSNEKQFSNGLRIDENNDTSAVIGNIAVKGLSDGGFVASWEIYDPSSGISKIFGRIFDSSYNEAGSPFQLSQDTLDSSLPTIALLQETVVFAWKSSSDLAIKRITKCTAPDCISCSNSADSCEECSLSSTSCYTCHNNCVTCFGPSSNECLSCITNAHLQSGECVCSQGYFASSTDPLQCEQCNELCENCEGQAETCTDCHNNMILRNNSCVCDTATYFYNFECFPCSSNCETCTDDSNCLECQGQVPLVFGECQCEDNQYVRQGECTDCLEKCSECSEESICTSCISPYVLVEGECECASGYFEFDQNCSKCLSFCSKCSNQSTCTQCDSTFVLQNNRCVCPENYSMNETSCFYNSFDCSFFKNADFLNLNFSESLSSSLSLSDIAQSYFLPSSSSFRLSIYSLSISEYKLRIEHIEVPSDTAGIYIQFNQLISNSGKHLRSEKVINELFMNETEIKSLLIIEEETEIIPIGASSEDTAVGAVAIGGSASLGLSLLSANPSSIWMFMNIVSLIYYMPLQNIGMPVEIKEFSKGFAGDLVKLVPGLERIPVFNDTDSSMVPGKWDSYGFETTDLFVNSSTFMISLAIGMFLLFLLSILYMIFKNREGKLKNLIVKGLNSFKWCFFLRLYIQTYIKLIVASMLNTSSIDDSGLTVQYLISIVLICFGLVSIVIITILTYIKRQKIALKMNISSYETFYYEFKCDRGFLSMLYYPLFLFRRFFYIAGLFYLEKYPLSQVIINSILSLIVLIYLFVFRPFVDSSSNVINILTEIVMTIMFCTCGLFLVELSEDFNYTLSKFFFTCAIFIIMAILIACFYKIVVAIKRWKNRKGTIIPLRPSENSANMLFRVKPTQDTRVYEGNYHNVLVSEIETGDKNEVN